MKAQDKGTKVRPSDDIEQRIDLAIAHRSGRGIVLPENECTAVPTMEQSSLVRRYEYMDHTADVQLHSWGDNMSDALENLAIAMFGYMTDLTRVQINEEKSREVGKNIEAVGHDIKSLVYAFLDEWLFNFHANGFVPKRVRVIEIDLDRFTVKSNGDGEMFNLEKHTQGTEVKAITYSNMQIEEGETCCHIWVIVDI